MMMLRSIMDIIDQALAFRTVGAALVLKATHSARLSRPRLAGAGASPFSPGRERVDTLVEWQAPADLGLNREMNRLYVPSFKGDFVQTYHSNASADVA